MQLNLRWQLIFFKNAKQPLHPSLTDDNRTFKLILYNGTFSIIEFKITFFYREPNIIHGHFTCILYNINEKNFA